MRNRLAAMWWVLRGHPVAYRVTFAGIHVDLSQVVTDAQVKSYEVQLVEIPVRGPDWAMGH